ncbi:hypothetical protein GQ55_5G289300 [Panicum hallii var. hallii]|uniref:Uncharacterized protein n=1 Tax=Panicum hallii var. hallii TaxID=1504633 RepID=A0A2T7DL99_9POAL|nr:hypothetical protein GQ55_5G289300 [Panicum hallii var. hallii]
MRGQGSNQWREAEITGMRREGEPRRVAHLASNGQDSRTGTVSYPIGMSSFSTFKAGIQLFGGRPSPVSFQDLLMRASNGVLNPSVCNEALNITTSSTSKDDACNQRKDVQILSIQFVATEMLE